VVSESGAPIPGAPLAFVDQAKLCFVEVHDAVQDMKALNEIFDITLTESELKIDMGSKGKFVFVIKPRGETLQYHSPVSGVLEYKFDPEERLWLQVDDRHDFRGMLTRDMLRVCIGYPKFK
jgi:frataxin-like iron-binding protein CyaY